jgi:hypothetical protein
LADFKTAKLALAGFQSSWRSYEKSVNPIGEKDLNSPVLKSFLQFQKLFTLKG